MRARVLHCDDDFGDSSLPLRRAAVLDSPVACLVRARPHARCEAGHGPRGGRRLRSLLARGRGATVRLNHPFEPSRRNAVCSWISRNGLEDGGLYRSDGFSVPLCGNCGGSTARRGRDCRIRGAVSNAVGSCTSLREPFLLCMGLRGIGDVSFSGEFVTSRCLDGHFLLRWNCPVFLLLVFSGKRSWILVVDREEQGTRRIPLRCIVFSALLSVAGASVILLFQRFPNLWSRAGFPSCRCWLRIASGGRE